MTQKRILIVNNNMHIGGVQRALIDLLKCIQDRYDITLALFHPEGELMAEIPAGIKVLPVTSLYRFLGMTKSDVKNSPLKKLIRSFFGAVARLMGRDVAISMMKWSQKQISGYDVAISYLHNAGDQMFYGGCNDFVLQHIDAPKKYAFLHCDYQNSGANTEKNCRQYRAFDRIAACSKGCRTAFLRCLPELEKKTVVVQNCQDYQGFFRRAEAEPVSLPSDRVNILTVARMGREKGIPRAIEAFAQIKDSAVRFHYYVIGDGVQRDKVESLIQKYGLETQVTLLGESTNPYGYMKAADILLVPSISEAAPLVIGEAASLGTPILTTETSSAVDMVEDTGYGWVCQNSVEGITEKVRELLADRNEILRKSIFLQQSAFDNRIALVQFDELLKDTPK